MTSECIEQLKRANGDEFRKCKASDFRQLLESALDQHKNTAVYDDQGNLLALHINGLEALEELSFSESESKSLQYLKISQNAQLQFVVLDYPLPNLRRLEITECKLQSMVLPPGSQCLKQLWLQKNNLQSFRFSDACPKLKFLEISENPIGELIFPFGFEKLEHVYAVACQITRVEFADNPDSEASPVGKLQTLNLSNNKLENVPGNIILSDALTALYLAGSVPQNYPMDMTGRYSKWGSQSCVDEAKAWFGELQRGSESTVANRIVKLMLLGNSDVGKSTLVETIKTGNCIEKDPESTHGIILEQHTIPAKHGDPEIELQIWDFGGQEIYHRTHRLFLKSPAIQLIVFDSVNEQLAWTRTPVPNRHDKSLFVYNYPVEYWYETTSELSPHSQFLLVQNLKPEHTVDASKTLGPNENSIPFVYLDVKKGTRRTFLEDAIKKHVGLIPEYGMTMPGSWVAVRQYFFDNSQLCNAGEGRQLITKDEFDQICEDNNVHETSRKALLNHLHNNGFLYTHDNLGEKLIADQRWALDIIYASLKAGDERNVKIIDKEGKVKKVELFGVCSQHVERQTSNELFEILLGFMLSCGICFKLSANDWEKNKDIDDLYVFPEFLPENEETEDADTWERLIPQSIRIRKCYDWVNPALIHHLIVRIGAATSHNKLWRYGIHVFVSEKNPPDSERHENNDPAYGRFRIKLEPMSRVLMLQLENTSLLKYLNSMFEELGVGEDEAGWEISYDGQDFIKYRPGDLKNISKQYSLQHEIQSVDMVSDEKNQGLPKNERSLQCYNVLFFSSSMEGKLINVSEEFQYVAEELDRPGLKYGFTVKPCSTVTALEMFPANLLNGYRPDRYHVNEIVHFISHGDQDNSKETFIRFHDERNPSKHIDVDPQQLVDSLCFLAEKRKAALPKLFLFNGCYSSEHARTVSELGAYAIGFTGEIGSVAALAFTRGFYQTYVCELDIEQAFMVAVGSACVENEEVMHRACLYKNGGKLDVYI